jgi:hypothetical protein
MTIANTYVAIDRQQKPGEITSLDSKPARLNRGKYSVMFEINSAENTHTTS